LEAQKGFEYFIRAAKLVVSELPRATFVIVGEGSQRARLSGLIQELGLEANVLLLGHRNDMPRIYASLDVFVLASVDEGMPMTVLEALSAGCPVIATRVGSVDKLIINGQTGLLVAPRDVNMLSSAILQSLRDPIFARGLGRNGKRHVHSSFSSRCMMKEYVEIYQTALKESKVKRAATSLQEA
jgi:glycosyltransferase involved in cell wall biosynthesis